MQNVHEPMQLTTEVVLLGGTTPLKMSDIPADESNELVFPTELNLRRLDEPSGLVVDISEGGLSTAPGRDPCSKFRKIGSVDEKW